MVLTRNKTPQPSYTFVFDTSGSTSKYISTEQLTRAIKSLTNMDANVSLYLSNHELKRLYFNNKGSSFHINNVKFGGLSSIYDNVVETLEHQLNFDSDAVCKFFIVSDMDDNNSLYYKKSEFNKYISNLSGMWDITIIHPSEIIIE